MAFRAKITGRVQGVGFREATRRRARELGLHGWVRNLPDGSVGVHVEGDEPALTALVEFLGRGPAGAAVDDVALTRVADEGHEQFAIRGVSAGRFVIEHHEAPSVHYDLRLEVGGVLRSWTLRREPSMDPAIKRLAIAQPAEPLPRVEGAPADGAIWDRGDYEQGGRVAWPEALDRGHAVFVLHGERLTGGFALQRTGAANWLLIKRREGPA